MEPVALIRSGPDESSPTPTRRAIATVTWAGAMVLAVTLAGGCCLTVQDDEFDPPSADSPTDPNAGWRLLFDRDDATGWLTVMGRMVTRDGAMHLNPARQQKTVAVGMPLKTRDGVIEVEAVRDPNGYENPGPYSIALRVRPAIDWSAVYFVCRHDRLDVHRANWQNQYPDPAAMVDFAPPTGPRTWRFEMSGEAIRVLLNGRHVYTLADPDPRPGTMAITADRCRLTVSRVDVKPQ